MQLEPPTKGERYEWTRSSEANLDEAFGQDFDTVGPTFVWIDREATHAEVPGYPLETPFFDWTFSSLASQPFSPGASLEVWLSALRALPRDWPHFLMIER